jgi:MFS family permease
VQRAVATSVTPDAPALVPGERVSAPMLAMLALALALMVANYLDRHVVVSIFPWLKAHWSLRDVELGAIVSVVSVAVAAGTVPLSYLADRFGRARSMAVMAIVWSGATILCAAAATYAELLVARAVVGLAEAGFGAAGAAVLGTLFPDRLRSAVIGAFLAASILGSVAGVAMGGTVAEAWGWRHAFVLAGIPGLVLGAVLLVAGSRLSRMSSARAEGEETPAFGRSLAAIVRSPVVVLAAVGGGLQLFTAGAVLAWLPTFLHRAYGLTPGEAGRWAAAANLTGAFGIVAWGVLADALASRLRAARLVVPAMAALATCASFTVAFAMLAPGPAQLAFVVAGAAVMAGSVGPLAAAVVEAVHPGMRATAASMLALTQNLLGLATGPFVVGALADRYGLPAALAAVPWFSAVAAIVLMAGARPYRRMQHGRH